MEKSEKIWPFSTLTYDKIMEVMKEIEEKSKTVNFQNEYNRYIVLGFATLVPDNYIISLNDDYQQDGKRIIVVWPGHTAHNAILRMEDEFGYKFDRLREDVARELGKNIYIGFTDEKGERYGTDTV